MSKGQHLHYLSNMCSLSHKDHKNTFVVLLRLCAQGGRRGEEGGRMGGGGGEEEGEEGGGEEGGYCGTFGGKRTSTRKTWHFDGAALEFLDWCVLNENVLLLIVVDAEESDRRVRPELTSTTTARLLHSLRRTYLLIVVFRTGISTQ